MIDSRLLLLLVVTMVRDDNDVHPKPLAGILLLGRAEIHPCAGHDPDRLMTTACF